MIKMSLLTPPKVQTQFPDHCGQLGTNTKHDTATTCMAVLSYLDLGHSGSNTVPLFASPSLHIVYIYCFPMSARICSVQILLQSCRRKVRTTETRGHIMLLRKFQNIFSIVCSSRLSIIQCATLSCGRARKNRKNCRLLSAERLHPVGATRRKNGKRSVTLAWWSFKIIPGHNTWKQATAGER